MTDSNQNNAKDDDTQEKVDKTLADQNIDQADLQDPAKVKAELGEEMEGGPHMTG